MNREEKIMKRVKEHYEYLKNKGYEEYQSDVDTKAIVLPSFEDFVYNKEPVSKTIVLENNEHIDVKDIRVMFEMFRKMNISYIELLYTKFKIINIKYKDMIKEIFEQRKEIASINKNQFLRCISGMSMEKVKALCHPYPGLIEKINKYGFDGKQLCHCVRLQEFIKRYVNGEKLEDCYISKIPNTLINFKKNLNEDGTARLDVEEAKRICDNSDAITKIIKDDAIKEPDIINEKGIEILNRVKYNILSYKFKEDICKQK